MLKLAIFDFDHTIVKPLNGRTFPRNSNDWQYLRPNVLEIIRNLSKKYDYIVIRSDQTRGWKINMIFWVMLDLNIPNIKFVISVCKKYNKPDTTLFLKEFPIFDKQNSFYCGDALNRVTDWSGVDKEFAERLNIPIYSPEEMFPIDKILIEYNLTFNEPTIVIMCGFPGSGKSTFAQSINNSVVIHGDIFKTTEKMLKEGKKYVNGLKTIIFDAVNATIDKRSEYINFAKQYNFNNVICVYLRLPIDKCIDRICKRVLEGGKHVPKVALYTLRNKFFEPSITEGFKMITIDT